MKGKCQGCNFKFLGEKEKEKKEKKFRRKGKRKKNSWTYYFIGLNEVI